MSKAPVTVRIIGINRAVLEVGGQDIANAITEFTLSGKADGLPPVLEVRLLPIPGEVECSPAQTRLDPRQVDALLALGWTPPVGAE